MLQKQKVIKEDHNQAPVRKHSFNINHLESRVKEHHQQKIKQLQVELVECSLNNKQQHRISPLLAEINKLRALMAITKKNSQATF